MASSSTNSDAICKDMAEYIPLHAAIVSGDWKKACEIFDTDKDALTAKIDVEGNRAVHLATFSLKHVQFLENLLNVMDTVSFPALLNKDRWNPLHYAAAVGNTTAAKMLVDKNPYLLFMPDFGQVLPILRAIMNSHKPTFQYLLDASKQHIMLSQKDGLSNPFQGMLGVFLVFHVINAGLMGVAQDLVKEFPHIATTKDENTMLLRCIARKWDAYYSSTSYNFYQRFVYSHIPIENNCLYDPYKSGDIESQGTHKTMCQRISCFYDVLQVIYFKCWKLAALHVPYIMHLQEDKVKHNKALILIECTCKEVAKLKTYSDIFGHYGQAFNEAVINDTPEAIEMITRFFPQAIWTINNAGYYLPQVAIINRCEKIYSFAINQDDNKHIHRTRMDQKGNNLLHLAGKLAPIHKLNKISGAALQMQRELQWFKEVEKYILPSDKEKTNNDKETPIMVFRREHKDLREKGEEWMKKTADSYTITAALIITIAFAAAITVPGGNDGNTGKAIYETKVSFIVFAVSDAISLFTSTTSLLLCLSILTARYREEDFLYRLPKRLVLGLSMLFLSVTSMMVAFSATLYLLFEQGRSWILIPIVALTCLPITSFVTLQFPLLQDVIYSTYGHGIFPK